MARPKPANHTPAQASLCRGKSLGRAHALGKLPRPSITSTACSRRTRLTMPTSWGRPPEGGHFHVA